MLGAIKSCTYGNTHHNHERMGASPSQQMPLPVGQSVVSVQGQLKGELVHTPPPQQVPAVQFTP